MQHYQNEMRTLSINIMDAKLSECEKIYDDDITKFWQNQRTLPVDQRLTPAIVDLMERRLTLITDKIQCLYHYKNRVMKL